MITDCQRCGERPERRDIVTVGAGVWWLVICCRPRLLQVAGDAADAPEPLPRPRDVAELLDDQTSERRARGLLLALVSAIAGRVVALEGR